MSLFSKPIETITYEEIVAFCKEKVRENYIVDYKAEIPAGDKLEKTVAAMANRYGGIIIIGVEDDDGYPKLPPKGIPFKRGFREQVLEKILNAIFPPLVPEIHVCPAKRKKTFILIRILPSQITPHAICSRKDIYVRTSEISHPELRATLEEIEWLQERRKKSESLKEQLIENAQERAQSILSREYTRDPSDPFGHIFLSLIPQFPFQPFLTPKAIADLLEEWDVDRYQIRDFHSRRDIWQSTQGGVFLREGPPRYLEINQFGLIYFSKPIGVEMAIKEKDKNSLMKAFHLQHFVQYLDVFLEYSQWVHEKMGVWGPLDLSVSVEEIGARQKVFIRESTIDPTIDLFCKDIKTINDAFRWERNLMHTDLQPSTRRKFVIEVGEEVGWSLGIKHITSSTVEGLLNIN